MKNLRALCFNHFKTKTSYADFGCSNGYVTNFIIKDNKFSRSIAYDFIPELINEGNSRFDFEIKHLDLNLGESPGKYENVSCFETLEHVTDLELSLKTIIDSIKIGGRAVVSVPIEVGVIGILKYLAKTLVFKYPLEELRGKNIFWRYLLSLIKNERISKYRVLDGNKEWCWHFGFDYRDVIDTLEKFDVRFTLKKNGTGAIFLIFK